MHLTRDSFTSDDLVNFLPQQQMRNSENVHQTVYRYRIYTIRPIGLVVLDQVMVPQNNSQKAWLLQWYYWIEFSFYISKLHNP